ncbi:MAG: DUF3352 domain-containing protein [Lewinellaceae bacterium]|nr:DUF3352 domain-containing protein [Lewinellaceae bacterium]
MKERLFHFLKKYRWWLAFVPALILLSISVYRFLIYPCKPGDAVPETTALLFHFGEGKSKDSGIDSTALPAFLNAFPTLSSDYNVLRGFMGDAGASLAKDGLWMVQNLGKGDLALAVVLDAPSFPWEERLSGFAKEEASFRGHSVFRLSLPGGKALAVARYRNLILIGRLPMQVESSIAQLKEGHNSWDLVSAQAGWAYLRPENLLSLGTGIVSPEARQALGRLERWNSGIALQLGDNGDTLSISGRMELNPEAGRRFSIPAQSRGEGVLAYLPSSLAWCYRQSAPEVSEAQQSELFEKYIRPWIGGDMAWLSLGLPGKPADSQLCLLAVESPDKAEEGLEVLAEALGSLQVYDYQSFRVYQILSDGLLDPLGFKAPNPYFVIMGDYLAISSTSVAIEQLISNVIVNNTLSQDTAFLGLYAQQGAGAKAWLYVQTGLSTALLPAYFQAEEDAFAALLRTYDAYFLSISPNGAFGGMAVKGQAAAEPPAALLAWKAALDAPATGAVQAFPLDETGPGYLVQDEANALYLLGANGARRWKKSLGGPILGEIQLIDYFGGALRDLAFVTPQGIEVLSGEGEARGHFSIPLESPAISPLLVADFEGQGQYCFFVACANGYLFGWDRQGRPLPGWNPQTLMDSTVHLAMAHFQYANKDFILALSDAGTLCAFQRDGAYRFEPVKLGAVFLSPPFYQVEGDISRIALADTEGFGHIVNLEGAYFRLRLLPEPGSGARFLFGNLTGDERKDYLCYRGAEMRAYYYEGNNFKPFFSRNLGAAPDTAFLIARPDYCWVGLLDKQAQKINLLDNKGDPVSGFPLAGSTPFVMAPLPAGGQLVVVGYGANVYAYRLGL